MRIVAVPGCLIRDPETRRIVGEEALTVDPTNLYWARLLADGDVAEASDIGAESDAEEAPVVSAKSAPAKEPKA
ncbi:hypothetical protein FHS31_000834 [Sphingomonas vulcanisoli]|uniref:DUF2635 domain-containing protein n=1 Tax=Sphingomonas vulcanisoli TaxID=1658060 RepID=A0ABX0TNY3_9SPHN|nr:DUF2635 domain-containing protein [Sphingomonas vulcanisoli]NIJ07238.1 hypothetical protein [Sphingomonas vulcanisoli]